MKPEDLLELMGFVGKLKELERTGWAMRGVKRPESVADHSFGTAILSMILAKDEGLDVGKAAMMALVHDLPEAVVGDIVPSDPFISVAQMIGGLPKTQNAYPLTLQLGDIP